jgi:cell division protein ZapA (FtsZ GTPase activity inhibitor)
MADSIYTVNIAGVDLTLYSSETEAETTSIVKSVNRRISQFEQGNKGAPKINSILMACMDLGDENRQLKAKLEKQRSKVASLKLQLEEAKKEIASLKAGE